MKTKTKRLRGGSCGSCQLPQMGGANCRIGVMNPTWGGRRTRKNRGGGCGCGVQRQPMMPLPQGIQLGSLTTDLMKGGGCGCGAPPPPVSSELLRGGACPCQAVAPLPIALGGYRATKRNLKYLKLYKQGKSIGFTMRSSLKAKGLIPRANGTKRVSAKYRK